MPLPMPELREVLGLLLVGAWVGADSTAFLQLMVSQPVVAGWLGGLVVGEPLTGLAVGVLLQALWGRSFALGAASFPHVGPAAVVGGALAGWASARASYSLGVLRVPDALALALALAAAFAVAEVGRRLVPDLRRRRGALVTRAFVAADSARPGPVIGVNLIGVVEEALLGILLVAGGVALGGAALRVAVDLPVLDGRWVAMSVLGVGLGYSLTMVDRGRRGLFWLGAAVVVVALGWVLS